MVAFAVAAAGTWVATRVARRVGLVDRPGPRKLHAAPVPLGGGVAVAAGLTAGIAGGTVPVPHLVAVWGLVAVGVIDDARDLRARTRLAAQVAASLPVAVLYAPHIGLPRPLEAILALLFLVAVINAMKCIDSADAVAGSVAVTAALSLGWLSAWEGPAGMASAALTGAAAGFLTRNVPPARCFLGEAGSTVLGFVLASVALATTAAAQPDRSLSVAVVTATVLTVPVLDFVVVHARRMRAGVRRLAELMASTGLDHLPHRLRTAGLGPRSVALTCAGAVALSGVAAHLCLQGGLIVSLIGGSGVVVAFLGAEIVLHRALVGGGIGESRPIRRRRGRRGLSCAGFPGVKEGR
jgi:UDP-GlcNAc:undecaprenyl-phosphate GlcNAc-1-phosphate transferase